MLSVQLRDVAGEMGCHHEGPAQAVEAGPCEHHEVLQGSAHWKEQPSVSVQAGGLRD